MLSATSLRHCCCSCCRCRCELVAQRLQRARCRLPPISRLRALALAASPRRLGASAPLPSGLVGRGVQAVWTRCFGSLSASRLSAAVSESVRRASCARLARTGCCRRGGLLVPLSLLLGQVLGLLRQVCQVALQRCAPEQLPAPLQRLTQLPLRLGQPLERILGALRVQILERLLQRREPLPQLGRERPIELLPDLGELALPARVVQAGRLGAPSASASSDCLRLSALRTSSCCDRATACGLAWTPRTTAIPDSSLRWPVGRSRSCARSSVCRSSRRLASSTESSWPATDSLACRSRRPHLAHGRQPEDVLTRPAELSPLGHCRSQWRGTVRCRRAEVRAE